MADYLHFRRNLGDTQGLLDDRTWCDLMLAEVFADIDMTATMPGAQLLYHRMWTVPGVTEREQFERLVSGITNDQSMREQAQVVLERLGDHAGSQLWYLCRPHGVLVRWWYYFFPVLTLAVLATLVATTVWSKAWLVLIALFAVNIVVRVATTWAAASAVNPMRQVGPVLRTAEQLLAIPGLDTPSAGAVRADLSSLHRLRTVARWSGRDALSGNQVLAALQEYLNLAFLLDPNALLFGSREVRKHHAALRAVLEWVGTIDAAISVASLRARAATWTVPLITAAGTPARIDNAWHPLLTDPVANSITLDPGRGVLVTGSNMSGKSTFLRTVGVAAVLARSLGTVPAAAWHGPLLTVRSFIGRADDLLAGKSYYFAEAEAVIALLEAARSPQPQLFLFDELFHGTNTIERLAASAAVFDALLGSVDAPTCHVVMAATHDGELVGMLAERYMPMHFRESVDAGELSFSYQLHSGAAATRTAIALLDMLGAPASVLTDARRRVGELDRRT